MDLLHFRTLNHPQISLSKKARAGEETVHALMLDPHRVLLVLGKASAALPWAIQRTDLLLEAAPQRPQGGALSREYLVSKGKDPDLVLLESRHAHHGQVNCLLYESIGDIDLLMTGSADRTIKLWEPKHAKEQNPCVQTLIGHGGTVGRRDLDNMHALH